MLQVNPPEYKPEPEHLQFKGECFPPPPPTSTTPLADGAFNVIGAHEGSLFSLMGEAFLAYPPPPPRKFQRVTHAL